MILDELIALAPPLPDFSAKFMGIYFEPMRDSGERLTIGVAAKALTGETAVHQTISDKTLLCMYGDKAPNMQGFVHDILFSAKQHLELGLELEDWRPPYTGVFMSKVHKTYSKTGIQGVIFQAITLYSSLCKDQWVRNIVNDINGITDNNSDIEDEAGSLIRKLREIIGQGYEHRWSQTLTINSAPLTIDYLGVKYNANLSNFDVKQVKLAFKHAKAKLFDLEVLRENRRHQVIDNNQQFELLVSLKNRSLEALEQFNYLEKLADKRELRVIPMKNINDFASHIRQKEAA